MADSIRINDLLAAAQLGGTFQDASGYRVGIVAETQWEGTLMCRYHALYLIQELRKIKKGFMVGES